jgi:2-polyprenyl-3-methyl-5-hydroxy-6-metoxy-1,4-benzoquinol methylase
MPTSPENVTALYSSIAEHEKNRLANHPMERELTLRTISHHLSNVPTTTSTPLRIADIGGGPGTLSFDLASQGHHVDLVDLTPALIAIARAEQARRSACSESLLASITVGNALDPPCPPLAESSYDAVLLFGPLYHLVEEKERKSAVDKALRLAKPGTGMVFCAFVTVEAHLRDLAMREPARLVEEGEFYERYLVDGVYQKTKALPAGRMEVQCFHIHSVDEVRGFFKRHFDDVAELVELRAAEGILGGGLDAKLAGERDKVVQAWADLLFKRYSAREEHLGGSDHLIAVLRRK